MFSDLAACATKASLREGGGPRSGGRRVRAKKLNVLAKELFFKTDGSLSHLGDFIILGASSLPEGAF